MPITFSCDHFENILMFAEVAKELLVLMGHSAVPGALKANDIPQALARLEAGIQQAQQLNTPPLTKVDYENEDAEPSVSLAHRAIPLISMLKSAIKHHCDVMWE